LCCRERDELARTVAKLQESLAQFREKEADATSKVQRSLNVVDQAQFEKTQVRSFRMLICSYYHFATG